MLRNYLKIAFRSLWRSKIHSFINVLGLSLGIACCVLIALFVKDEWTFDTFHTKADRIYRVYAREDYGENEKFFNTVTPFPMGPALKENFGEVEHQVRINNIGSAVKVGENLFNEQITVAGQDFFELFDFEIVNGNREALHEQSGILLTQATAKKYFGEADPINKAISIQLGESFEEFTVKAVTTDVPINSSIQYQILISDLNYPKLYSPRALTSAWFNITPETYVLLKEGVSSGDLESKFPSVFQTLLGEESFKESNYAPGLQPLTEIHLDTSYPAGIAPVSDPKYSYILAAIAILILLVACINFVTLSIGRSMKRAREVGIRKVVGAERKQLIFQFIGEAVIVTVIALLVGIVLSVLGLPVFNNFAGKQLVLAFNGFTITMIASLIAIIGLMAGSYPAFVLSGFKPITILKGSVQTGNNKQRVRQILVGVQLVLSIFLISSTLIMRQQLSFLQSKNLGFNKEQLAVIQLSVPNTGRLPERVKAGFEKAEQFKIELAKVQGIAAVCATAHDFGNGAWTNIGYTDDNGSYRTFTMNIVDDEYVPTMKMEMVWGRNFSDNNPSDARRSIIVNEAFAKEYGWTDPVGKRIPGKGFADHEVIGIIKDFNYASLYTSVQPLVMVQDPAIILSGTENINFDNSPIPKLMVRVKPENMSATLEQIKTTWNNLTGGEEFAFSFVDQAMDNQYRSDQNLGKIVSIATLLAMIIGSLGLYALASLAMQNRTKEISIRKVMGATEQSLLVLLSKDYVLLIAVSLMLSVPITWYLMDNWLQSFQYRVSVGWQVFAAAGGLSLVIALLTISYQAIKTAWTRPAETLKYE
jgi:putative ABC transport system permease protein